MRQNPTRRVEAEGLGAKLETEKAGRKRSEDLEAVRARWAEMTNERLRESGLEVRVDHRSLAAQGIKREPSKHLGPAASGYERRTGKPSRKRLDFEEVAQQLARAKEAGELERQSELLKRSMLDLSGDMEAAIRERDQLRVITAGVTTGRAEFQAERRAAREALEQRQAQERQRAEAERAREVERQRQERAKQRGRDGPSR